MSLRTAALLASGLAVLLLAACGGGGQSGDAEDPEDFQKFAATIARAAEENDVAFFRDRILGKTHTCTESEVEQSTGPNAPPGAICLEVGLEFESIYIGNWGSLTDTKTPENLGNEIEFFFELDEPREEDTYGPGAGRLYATAVPVSAGDAGVHSAILASIRIVNQLAGRTVLALDFEFVGGRWVIRGGTKAGFPIAVDLLEPEIAVASFEDWARYER